MAKGFKDKAAAAFISNEAKDNLQTLDNKPEEGVYVISDNQPLVIQPKENKSKSVQLLMKPSLHEKVKKAAAKHGVSFNEFVGLLLDKYVV